MASEPSLWLSIEEGSCQVLHRFATRGNRWLLVTLPESGGAPVRRLSPRERTVLKMAASGDAMKLIAFAIGVNEATVASYFASARTKAGFATRSEAIFWINRIRSGELVMRRKGCVLALATPLGPPLPGPLTDAERGVVSLAAAGLSNGAIATARRVSERTVANQLASAFRKLGVGSRFELTSQWSRGDALAQRPAA